MLWLMQEVETLFATLADAQRLRILNVLHTGESACVCELVDALRIPQYQVSRQLRVLRDAGLVTSEKRGAWVYYAIAPDMPLLAETVIRDLGAYLDDRATGEDRRRLVARLRLREDGVCALGYPVEAPYREEIPVVSVPDRPLTSYRKGRGE